MRLKPAIRYQLHEFWVGGFVFFLFNVGFVALCFLGLLKVQGLEGEGFAFNWYDFSCAIYFFVLGLILPRQAARLCVQMGVSRRTAYLSLFLSALPAALAMAAAGQVLLAGSNLAAEQVAPAMEGRFIDLFSLVYHQGSWSPGVVSTPLSILYAALFMLVMYALGLFFTLLFWRLNKLGCIIAVLALVVLATGVPTLFTVFSVPLAPVTAAFWRLWNAFLASPWVALLLFLVVAAILALIGWLLIRRTNIRAGMLSRQ